MENQLLNTINIINKINKFLSQKDSEFDSEDVVETFQESKKRLANFIKELQQANMNDKAQVNKLLVHIELEYANLIWSLQEMRDFINRTLVNYPD